MAKLVIGDVVKAHAPVEPESIEIDEHELRIGCAKKTTPKWKRAASEQQSELDAIFQERKLRR